MTAALEHARPSAIRSTYFLLLHHLENLAELGVLTRADHNALRKLIEAGSRATVLPWRFRSARACP